MAIVAVYKFRALFHDNPALGSSPAGLSRQGLLLLRQDADVRADAAAIAACATHGARDATIERYAVLDPASLAHPQGREFAGLHATALKDGSAMMFYLHTAPPSEAPLVTSAGFGPDLRTQGRH